MPERATPPSARLRRLPLALAAGCLALLAPAAAAGQAKCANPAAAAPSVFVTFERVAGAETGKSDALLRLTNGSACAIVVGRDSAAAVIIEPDGRLWRFDGYGELPDGARVGVEYVEHETPVAAEDNLYYGRNGCVVVTSVVPAGHSVLFRVPLKTFERELNISVPFRVRGDADETFYGAVFNWYLVTQP